jgi:hypothetical protein
LISKETSQLLTEWGCTDNIFGMVFDTTSSNTGHKTAACIAIQRDLDRHLLWFACRHHVGEVILDHVWNALAIEVSKSPEISIFGRLKNSWNQLTYR